MKFTLSVKQGDKFLTVGNVKLNKSGRSYQVTLFADKTSLLTRSECGRFINCLMTQDTRPSFGGAGTTQQAQAVGVADWLPDNNSLKTDLPF